MPEMLVISIMVICLIFSLSMLFSCIVDKEEKLLLYSAFTTSLSIFLLLLCLITNRTLPEREITEHEVKTIDYVDIIVDCSKKINCNELFKRDLQEGSIVYRSFRPEFFSNLIWFNERVEYSLDQKQWKRIQ